MSFLSSSLGDAAGVARCVNITRLKSVIVKLIFGPLGAMPWLKLDLAGMASAYFPNKY
jgi:hypothetical protein